MLKERRGAMLVAQNMPLADNIVKLVYIYKIVLIHKV
jgi:hypothetical protein